ncbi:hypothetical protein P8452_49643 [Trifolium repens]|nr:hypothetical protein P8452_49643 [Trifolium repens]
MNLQPKMEPGSPSTSHIILDRDEDETYLTETAKNLEDKTIPDLVEVLRVAYLPKTFDNVEAVLLSRDHGLRDQIQLLQQNVEMMKQQLQEEKLARLKAEEEVKKRERVCEEGKKLEQRYTTLLKELKRTDLAADRDTVDILRKRNIELKEMWGKEKSEVKKYEVMLKEAEMRGEKDRDAMEELKKKKIEFECEVKQLNEKRVVDGKAFDVLRTMMVELENQILELKGKKTEDDKSFDELREKNGELKNEVLELQSKVRRVLEDDRKGLAEIEIKNGVLKETVKDNLAMISRLKNENSSLAEEKRKGEILSESLNMKFKELHERVAKMEDDTELLMRVDASWGRKNEEGDPPGDPMVAEFGNDTVQAAPLPRNEDAQPQNIGSKDAQGSPSASGRLKVLVDTDDDQFMSRGVHEKNVISGIAVKNDHPTPSSSIAVEMAKIKRSIVDSETSSSGSSCDLSFLDNLASRFVVSEAKKKKM